MNVLVKAWHKDVFLRCIEELAFWSQAVSLPCMKDLVCMFCILTKRKSSR